MNIAQLAVLADLGVPGARACWNKAIAATGARTSVAYVRSDGTEQWSIVPAGGTRLGH